MPRIRSILPVALVLLIAAAATVTPRDARAAAAPAAPAADVAQAAPTDASVEARRAEFEAQYHALIENQDGLSEDARLLALFDLVFKHQMFENPIFGVMIGAPGAQMGRWGDLSLAADERQKKFTHLAHDVLDSIDRSKLSEANQLNYDLSRYQIEMSIAGEKFPGQYLVIDQMGGPQQWIPQVLTQLPVRTVAGYEGLIEYLHGVPELLHEVQVRLEKGLETGVVPPKVTLGDVAAQIDAQAPDDVADSPLLQPFENMPESIPEADRERLQAEARKAIADEVIPTYRELGTFWRETYLPATRDNISLSSLPGGQEWYAYNVRQMTTTDLTPAQIHEIGLEEVKRIRAEMEQVIADSGFDGTFEEFLEFLRTDPQFFFDTPDELLSAYRDIAKRIDPQLVTLFGKLPRLPYGVTAVPDYSAKSQTTAYYQPGSLEGGRPGYFTANTYDLASRPKWEMEALTLHEAVPGHHLQISLAQELENVPEFRKRMGTTAFVEGWALYAESLGEEIGLYEDPYSKFGQLTYEMWRAIRLVVDTGIHSMGWTRQQAIDYFKQNTGKAAHDIEVEVDRYIVWPGQALAYKIGELKIKELRAFAEKELGDDFDIRAFHDTVLENGAVPLDVLDHHVREWVATRKAELNSKT